MNSWEKMQNILDSYPGNDAHTIDEAKERKSLIAKFVKIPCELQRSKSTITNDNSSQLNNFVLILIFF